MASNSPDTPPRLKLKNSYNDFGTLKGEKRNSFGNIIPPTQDTPPKPKPKISYNDFGTLKVEKRNSFGRLIEPTPQQPSSPVDDQLRLIWRKKPCHGRDYYESDAGGDEQTDSVSILLQ